MLVHICCSVDSHYFLKKLQEEYPGEKLVGFFYDPNIHPYSEYYLGLLDVRGVLQSNPPVQEPGLAIKGFVSFRERKTIPNVAAIRLQAIALGRILQIDIQDVFDNFLP